MVSTGPSPVKVLQPRRHRTGEYRSRFPEVAEAGPGRYCFAVNGMTRQEQLVVFAIIGLLLLGLAVKTWRTAHPPSPVVQTTH